MEMAKSEDHRDSGFPNSCCLQSECREVLRGQGVLRCAEHRRHRRGRGRGLRLRQHRLRLRGDIHARRGHPRRRRGDDVYPPRAFDRVRRVLLRKANSRDPRHFHRNLKAREMLQYLVARNRVITRYLEDL